ncbi:hypothetical protein [Rubrivirga litoralis]|uniref:Uncharacterized protein n=1 Tax=Rubrivirga litoralis TaxID=3075598 RepID=A0ABU3BMC7_9BACT|nr:hypothetical protein [Rubrivirga sp. F394]MDT0630450.1 hypothetical protein [Rubrivirga sp. F394]
MLLAALTACDSGADGPLGGRYDVTLFEGGAAVATGTLRLDVEDLTVSPAAVSGRWQLEPAGDGDASGVSGDGVLRGTYDGEAVRLSLLVGPEGAPELDAGVGLDGTVAGDEIRGEWGAGFSDGPAGTFEARR